MNKKDLDLFEKKIEDNINKEDTLLDDEAMEENLSDYDLSSNTTEEKISKLPWLVAFFLIVIISITTCSMFLNNNPQTIFTMAIDNFFTKITDDIGENAYDISKGNIKIDFDINSNDENSNLYRELSKNKLDINYRIDSTNNQSFFKIKTNYENKESLSLQLYNDKNNMYVHYDNIFDKYIKYENNNYYKTIRSNEYKTILNGLNQAFDKVATSEKITNTKNNLDYDIKTLKVHESKLIINKKNYKRVSDNFINSLKSNEEFISSISNILNISSSDAKIKLNKLSKILKNYFKEAENFEVILYTDRNTKNFIKAIFTSKLGTFEIINKEDTYLYNFNDIKNNIKSDGSIKTVTNSKKDKYDINIIMNLSLNDKVINSKYNIIFTNKKASSFGKTNIKDYVKNSDLNELDKIEIYSKLLENPTIKTLKDFMK